MMKAGIATFAILFITLFASTQEASSPQAVPAPGGLAVIADFKGDVSIKAPDQSPITPQRALALQTNSTIETGKGSVLLQMQDGSQVLVRSKSRVVISAPADSKGHWFDLMVGKIKAKVQKHLENQPPFRLGTPTAVITVRGTEFEVEVDKKNKTSVYVYDGIVEFAALSAPDRPVLIRPGFSSQAQPDRPAEQPRRMEAPSRDMEDRSGTGGRDSGGRDSGGRDSGGRDSEGSDSDRNHRGNTEPSDRNQQQPDRTQSREKPD